MGTAIAISPTIAPIIGGKISTLWGWEVNFALILYVAVATYVICQIGLIETLDFCKRQPISLKNTFTAYLALFSDLRICGYAFISGMTYGSLWAWIALAPFFFIQNLGISVEEYGYYAMIGPISYMGGAFINQTLVTRFGIDRMLRIGLVITIAGSFYLNIVSFYTSFNKWGLVGGLVLFCLGLAPVFSNAATRTLDVPENQRGAASAVLGLVEMVLAAAYAYGASWFNDGTIRPATVMMAVSAILCIVLYILIQYSIKYLHRSA